MFHDGDLRSGIAQSLLQDKLLACFIYEENDATSATWEEHLQSRANLISQKMVIVKFTSTSQEASYLTTFCPFARAPTIVVMKYGAMVEKFEEPLQVSDLLSRLDQLLSTEKATASTSAQVAETPSEAAEQSPIAGQSVPTEPATAHTQGQARAGVSTQEPVSPATLQSLLPDRAARLEADQAAKQAAEKAARVARAEAARREIEEAKASAALDKGKGRQGADGKELGRQAARAEWVQQQAKQKELAKKDRERILQQIESDRQERKHRAAVKNTNVPVTEISSPRIQAGSKPVAGNSCALQVRLIDGSSIKGRFAPADTLAKQIRAWVRTEASPDSANASYAFRLIQPPQPSKDINKDEEEQTLADLGLLPSATLILVARPATSTATTGSILSYVASFLIAVLSSIHSFFGLLLGTHRTSHDMQDSSNSPSQAAGLAEGQSSGAQPRQGQAKLRSKTLADARVEAARDDGPAEFYNGNSSAFEGRKDDDDAQ